MCFKMCLKSRPNNFMLFIEHSTIEPYIMWYSNMCMKSTQPCNDNKKSTCLSRLIFIKSIKVYKKNVMEQRLFLFYTFLSYFPFFLFLFSIWNMTFITCEQECTLSNFPSISWTKKNIIFFAVDACVKRK